MGDFNLSHRIAEDKKKIDNLCCGKRINSLNEITRSISNNQLDYILIDESLKENSFVTSYNNFISDHKAIVTRVGLNQNIIRQTIKERLTFDYESHLKQKEVQEDPEFDTTQQRVSSSEEERETQSNEDYVSTDDEQDISLNQFNRRIKNPDMASCWLNSCLQLLFTAMDYDDFITEATYSSELGKELLHLNFKSRHTSIDPTSIKDILVAAEDIRIATRLSELSYEVLDKAQQVLQSNQVSRSRLDLRTGQQCVRDFFICLNQNLTNWPDVFSTFSFRLTHSTECQTCQITNEYETAPQLYLELDVPPNNEDLKDYVEDYLSKQSRLECLCEGGCNKYTQKIKKTSITSSDEVKFLTVILTRGIVKDGGYHLVQNKILSTNDIYLR